MTSTTHVKQRIHNRNSHNGSGQPTIVSHQVQPSTSCEQQQQSTFRQQQQQPNYEAATLTRVPVSYHQIPTHYNSTHETLHSGQFNARNNSQTQQV